MKRQVTTTSDLLKAYDYMRVHQMEFNNINAPEASRKLLALGYTVSKEKAQEIMEHLGLKVHVRGKDPSKKTIHLNETVNELTQKLAIMEEMVRKLTNADKDSKEQQQSLGL